MAAGKHGSSEVTVTLDDHGGTPRTMTAYVTAINGLKLRSTMQGSTPFGVAFEQALPSGMSGVDPITLHGFFDDTATSGPHVVFSTLETSPQDTSRTFAFSPGNSKLFGGECWAQDYTVLGKVGNLTEYEATLKPTGTWAWT